MIKGRGKLLAYVHSPVLVNEVLTRLVRTDDKYFLDCTTGEGGHSEAVLKSYENIKVVGIDRDSSIMAVAKERMVPFGQRFTGIKSNFTDLRKLSEHFTAPLFDSVLIDLGISVFHYKESQRGFSYANPEKLDMRLDEEGTSAFYIVNEYSQEELTEIFFTFGEERFSRQIARKIVEKRDKAPIEYADQLAEIILSAIPARFKGRKTHPATKIFQAIRIAANNELENIKKGIPEVLSWIKKGGRLGVITFHSLEDRMVKNIFREMSKECICPPNLPICVCDKVKEVELLSRAIKPTEEEIKANPPSRSAKLRIVEKLV